MKWEYQVVKCFGRSEEEVGAALNELGAEGWELVWVRNVSDPKFDWEHTDDLGLPAKVGERKGLVFFLKRSRS
jgi:hypothetical protein